MTIVNGMTFQCNSNTWKSIFSFVMEAGEWIRNKCWMNTKNYKKKYTFLLRNGNMRTNEWKEREKNELKARWQRKILFEIGFENAWPPYDAKKTSNSTHIVCGQKKLHMLPPVSCSGHARFAYFTLYKRFCSVTAKKNNNILNNNAYRTKTIHAKFQGIVHMFGLKSTHTETFSRAENFVQRKSTKKSSIELIVYISNNNNNNNKNSRKW